MLLGKLINKGTVNNFHQMIHKIHNLRNLSYIQGIKVKKMNEPMYKRKDNMPEDYSIIYRAPMENYLMVSKNFTTITAGIVSILCFYKYSSGEDITNITENTKLTLIVGGSDLVIFTCGFLLITIILRLFLSKYPLRIYKKNDNYTAVFQGQIPFRNSKYNFNKGEITEAKNNLFNPWNQVMYRIRNKNVILFLDYFKTPHHFTEMFSSPKK